MDTVICVKTKELPASIKVRKNGMTYEHRATNLQRENCTIGWLIWTLNQGGQFLSDVYGVVAEGKFEKKIAIFLIFSDSPNPEFNAKPIEHDLQVLLDASWRVQVQMDTTTLANIVNLDSRKSPAVYEWIIGKELEFQRVEDMILSLAQQGRYGEAACLAKSTGFEKAPEIITTGLTSIPASGNTDSQNVGRV